MVMICVKFVISSSKSSHQQFWRPFAELLLLELSILTKMMIIIIEITVMKNIDVQGVVAVFVPAKIKSKVPKNPKMLSLGPCVHQNDKK